MKNENIFLLAVLAFTAYFIFKKTTIPETKEQKARRLFDTNILKIQKG